MRRETSDGQTERGDLSFGVPQGFAQLHSGRATKGKRLDGQARRLPRPTWQSYAGLPPEEGACVTFHAVRPLERGTQCWEISRLRFAALEMTIRHVPVRSLPADWYLRPLRTLIACSARILQRMRELANLSALGNPMQNFHSLKGQREFRRAFRLSADRPRMTGGRREGKHVICLFFWHTETSCEEMISFFAACL